MSKTVEFVTKYYEAALKSEEKYGIPAIFKLAQGALESGWGKHAIGYNVFGIKPNKGWEGKTQYVQTYEYWDNPDKKYPEIVSITPLENGKYEYIVKTYFKDYNSIEECFEDHNKVLLKKRYQNAFNFYNSRMFAAEIAAGGYATSLTYVEKMNRVIDRVAKIIDEKGLDKVPMRAEFLPAKKFVKAYYRHAVRLETVTNVPEMFILAQAALRTRWGQNASGNLNDYFEEFRDPKYKDAFEFLDPKKFAKEIAELIDPHKYEDEIDAIGYGVDVNYKTAILDLINIISKYGLAEEGKPRQGVVSDNKVKLLSSAQRGAISVIKGTLIKGTEVEILERGNKLSKVKAYISGWVAVKYLKKKKSNKRWNAKVNARKLNIRIKPEGDKLTKALVKGTPVEIIEERKDWAKVIIAVNGYAKTKSLDIN